MKDVAKHPRLARRNATYYFRAKVPLDLLQHYTPKREIVYSLGTKDSQEAVERVRVESVRLDQEFAEARQRLSAAPRATLEPWEIERLAALYYHDRLVTDEARRRAPDPSERTLYLSVQRQLGSVGVVGTYTEDQATAAHGMSHREYQKALEAIEWLLPNAKAALAKGDIGYVEEDLGYFLESCSVVIDSQSPAFKSLAFSVLKAEVRALEDIKRRNAGDVVDTPQVPAWTTTAPVADGDQGISLSTLWRAYLQERRPPAKTESDFSAYVDRFIDVNGDLPVRSITKAHVRDFKDAMLQFPKRLNGELRKLTVPDVIARVAQGPTVEKLAVRTVNDKALGAISAIFGYAVQNGYCDQNPATGIKATGSAPKGPARVPYTIDDLNLIFGSSVFTVSARPTAGGGEAAKWIPLLALFTGARLEELGQLLSSDIGRHGEIDFIFFHEDGAAKKLKNQSARRKVPLHPDLVKVGFLDYVADVRKTKSDRLFPKLGPKTGKVTAGFSKWWGRYTNDLGITDSKKVFHSFRHTVKRGLRDANVDKTLRDAIQGHATTDVAESYGLDEDGIGVSLTVLAEAISKLSYQGLDLTHSYSHS
jgi:integrase